MRPQTLVTGAFSYTGAFAAQEFLRRGHHLRTLTSHARPTPWASGIEVFPYNFDDPAALRRSLAGVGTLVNTFWIRFPRRGLTFEDAVENIRILMEAAQEAGVQRIVHISVSNPSHDSPYPYYRGKARAEDVVRGSGLSYAIIRPTWVYGDSDILLNNVAWLLRRFPVFGMPGNGSYRVQPIAATDLAHIIADFAESREEQVRDAAGPGIFSFNKVVELVQAAIGTRRTILHVPPTVALALGRVVGLAVRDVVLTRYEIGGLMSELLVSKQPPLGRQEFPTWVSGRGPGLGRRWASELERHFRHIDPKPFKRV